MLKGWLGRKLNPRYSLQLNVPCEAARGIVRCQLVTSHKSLMEQPVLFSVEIDTGGKLFRVTKEVIPGRAEACWIGIHTHLLTNGRCQLNWSAGDWHESLALRVCNEGEVAEGVRAALAAQGIDVFLVEPCDAGLYEQLVPELIPWYDREDCHAVLDGLIRQRKIPQSLEAPFRQFLSDGWFEILHHLDQRLLSQLKRDMDEAAAAGDSGFTEGSSQRLELMHLKYRSFWDLATYRPTRDLVDCLMQVPSEVCQVLGFVNGTQQDPHQDSIHLTSYPRGYMCGAWLALEDVQPDSGELVIYPGSHRWDALTMQMFSLGKVHDEQWHDFGETVVRRWQEMADTRDTPPLVYRPKAGTLLVWHDRLMHGGLPRKNASLTRRSCVTHHFGCGALVFHDSTGLPGKLIERSARRPSAWRRRKWRRALSSG